jgi:hypothetical protein
VLNSGVAVRRDGLGTCRAEHVREPTLPAWRFPFFPNKGASEVPGLDKALAMAANFHLQPKHAVQVHREHFSKYVSKISNPADA